MKSAIILIEICIILPSANGFQGGVRCEAVTTMDPKVSSPAQTSKSPYGIRVFDERDRLVTKFEDDQIYTVEIYGRCGVWTPIEGFLLVSRDKNSREIIGEFRKDDSNYWQASHYPCRDVKLGSVTHYIAYKRIYPVKFHWSLNSYVLTKRLKESADIIFEALVFQSANVYWKDLAWPENPKANCHCDDKQDIVNCTAMVRNSLCDSESVRDNCAFACNDCSSASLNTDA